MSEQHEPFVFVSRYDFFGKPMPNTQTVCKGQCEGMGMYPVFYVAPGVRVGQVRPAQVETNPADLEAWRAAHRRCSLLGRVLTALNLKAAWKFGLGAHWREVTSRCDGWHFVRCPDCSGTGVRRIS